MNNRYRLLVMLFAPVIFLIACSGPTDGVRQLVNREFSTINGTTLTLQQHMGAHGLVVAFLAPDCPLCINYSQTLNALCDTFQKQGIGFAGVFPGTLYSRDSIAHFTETYQLSFPAVLDPGYVITHELQASVTPEVVLINSRKEVVYRGAIDDWAYETGRRKLHPDLHYLHDALLQTIHGQPVLRKETQPVGCLIE